MSQPFQSAVDLEGGSRERLQVTELIGTSTESWEDAAATAVRTARETLRDLRVAEVAEQDIHIGGNDGVAAAPAGCGALLRPRELKPANGRFCVGPGNDRWFIATDGYGRNPRLAGAGSVVAHAV